LQPDYDNSEQSRRGAGVVSGRSPTYTGGMDRNRTHGWQRLATLLGILVVCAGTTSSRSCSLGSSDNSGDGGNDPTFVTTLQLQDATGDATDSFERDELIQMILTVRNRTDEAQTVDFTTSLQSDFVVVRQNTDNVVWQLSEVDSAPSETPTTLDFAPNEIKTITTTWNQVDNDGDNTAVGTYEARGVIVFDDFDQHPLRASQLGSPLVRFTIN
jgi:Intracellular proteinase inhibitor